MPKTSFEWVIVMNRGEEYFLTDNQMEALMATKDRFIKFRDTVINPAYVVSSYRRPAQKIKEYYPCDACHTNGFIVSEAGKPFHLKTGTWPECPACEGIGVKLP